MRLRLSTTKSRFESEDNMSASSCNGKLICSFNPYYKIHGFIKHDK